MYVSYDSTNKNCQAGDLELVEQGHPKIDTGAPIVNYSIAYDTTNSIPLFYEAYPASIVDGSYRLDHAVTATQKEILKAFQMDAASYIKSEAVALSKLLAGLDRKENN